MKNENKFDAVQMMREIRDKLSKEFADMNYYEQKKYINERLQSKVKLSIFQKQKKETSNLCQN